MSTFFGLNIAASGLRAYQAAANTTANNISNVDTDGYSKQVTNMKANSALRSYTNYGTLSTGVSAESITQLRSNYYDNKFRQYAGFKGEYTEKITYMDQLQTYFQDDSSVQGFSTVYSKFFNSLDSLSTQAEDASVRKQLISDAKNLCSYFNSTARALKDIQTDLNAQIYTTVSTVNSIAQKIALLNDQINDVEVAGAYANDLRDQRNTLLDKLSGIVNVEIKETNIENSNYPEAYTGATNLMVKINGITIVDGNAYRQLECQTRKYVKNQNDAEGLYDIVWTDSKEEFITTSNSSTGSLKGLMELRDGNNHENFYGTVTAVHGLEVVIEDTSITRQEALNMPSEGTILLSNKEYTYTKFEMTKNELNGKITFTFTLSGDSKGQSASVGHQASIGNSVDYKGIPYYQSQMNEFLRTFAKKFNDIEQQGVALDGVTQMESFFTASVAAPDTNSGGYNAYDYERKFTDDNEYKLSSTKDTYYLLTAATFSINLKSDSDTSFFATSTKEQIEQGIANSALVTELQKLQSKEILYRGSGGSDFLQYITSDVTVDAEEAELLNRNYNTIVNICNNQRTSVAGVDEDEEALDLVKFRNAYNLCSKVIQVMSEMYDRLITQTGV
ncbi:MAG: flagellar hook-associated protein FlgK [Lachnospiraceae bacterium]|nr:flagellar hook-associated protein FlgK [Lachnospiraceae bacterium]